VRFIKRLLWLAFYRGGLPDPLILSQPYDEQSSASTLKSANSDPTLDQSYLVATATYLHSVPVLSTS
jgi:hypothetical protein